MTQKGPQTLEEKIDHLLYRTQALEAHFINNIIKIQEAAQPSPELETLIIRLNDYTRNIDKMHTEACKAYGKMKELVDVFRKECEPYGEIKFLNKKLHEIQELLKKILQKQDSTKGLSWIEELSVELKKIKPEEVEHDNEYEEYKKRVAPLLSSLDPLEGKMLLFRCRPTLSGHLTTYQVVCKEFNVRYSEARGICRRAIKKLDVKGLAKSNEHNLLLQYYHVTGKWLNKS